MNCSILLNPHGLAFSVTLATTLVASLGAEVPDTEQAGAPAGYQRMRVSLPVPQLGISPAARFFRVEATKAP